MSLPKGVSVIICCFNSAERIPKTLEYISQQNVRDNISWEILLINNASKDRTVEVAKEFWSKFGSKTPFAIYDQPIPGLTAAKSKGIEKAKYDYLLFCDDDNWLCKTYVETAFDILEKYPNVGVVGGRGEAVSDKVIPFWFNNYQVNYAVGVQALNTGIVTEKKFVWGAGMVFRKSIYYQLKNAGFTHFLDGRKGKQLTAGEDSEVCRWFILAGYDLYYDESLFFYHYITSERLTKEYLEKMHNGFNEANVILNKYDFLLKKPLSQSIAKKTINLLWGLFHLIKLRVFLSKNHRLVKYQEKQLQLYLPEWVPALDSDLKRIILAIKSYKKKYAQNTIRK